MYRPDQQKRGQVRLKLCEAAELGVNSQWLGVSRDHFAQQSHWIQLRKKNKFSEFGDFETEQKDQVFK